MPMAGPQRRAVFVRNASAIVVLVGLVGVCIWQIDMSRADTPSSSSSSSSPSSVTMVPSPSSVTMVPPVLYKSGPLPFSRLPRATRDLLLETASANPDWRVVYLDDDEARCIVAREAPHPGVIDAFDRLIPGAFRADLLRYTLLWSRGGVWSDLTQQFHVPISTLVDRARDLLVLVRDRWTIACGRAVQISFMAAAPRRDIFREALGRALRRVHSLEAACSSIGVTGPEVFEYVLSRRPNETFRMDLFQASDTEVRYSVPSSSSSFLAYSAKSSWHRASLANAPHYSAYYSRFRTRRWLMDAPPSNATISRTSRARDNKGCGGGTHVRASHTGTRTGIR